MALGDQAGKAAVDEIIKQLPIEQQFIANIVQLLVDSVKSDVVEGVTALADGISQIVGLGQSIDGATITFEMEPIIVKAKFTISMPLKSVK